MRPVSPSIHSEKKQTYTLPGVGNRTLMAVRWVAVTGQTVALVCVHFGLHIPLPLTAAFGLILASVVLNFLMGRVATRAGGLSTLQATFSLAFDIFQISGLLFLTGGIENPFSILLLAPVTVGASLLPLREVLFLMVAALGSVSFLSTFYLPLSEIVLPPLYLSGLGFSLFLTLLFTTGYVWWTANEARRIAGALHESRLVLSRQSRVAALGAQAAAVAHELGSPLSTIYVIVGDLKKEFPPEHPLASDFELLVSQAKRCKDILSSFSRRPEGSASESDPIGPLWPRAFLSGIVDPFRMERPEIEICIEVEEGKETSMPLIARTPERVYGLGNLIQNAIQFASKKVLLCAAWDREAFSITIEDDGPGFSHNILARLGEPYLSSRRGNGRNMGLGVFISRTMLEPDGATLHFSNRPEGGAKISLVWARKEIESGPKKD